MTGPDEQRSHPAAPQAPRPPERSFSPSAGSPTSAFAGSGVPPRPAPLPPPRTVAPAVPQRVAPRPAPTTQSSGAQPRPVTRGRRARLTLRRVDPWSVFLFSVVASIFLGVALLVAVAVMYGVLSSLGVLDSINTLIGDVTSDPADPEATPSVFGFGRVMSVTAVVAALDVVLLTALATLGAFLYNLCSSLTGGVELTFGDRE